MKDRRSTSGQTPSPLHSHNQSLERFARFTAPSRRDRYLRGTAAQDVKSSSQIATECWLGVAPRLVPDGRE